MIDSTYLIGNYYVQNPCIYHISRHGAVQKLQTCRDLVVIHTSMAFVWPNQLNRIFGPIEPNLNLNLNLNLRI